MSQKLSKRQLLSKGTKSLIDKSKLQTRRGRPKVKCDWCKTDCIEHKTSFVENDKVYNQDLCAGCHILFQKLFKNTYHSERIY